MNRKQLEIFKTLAETLNFTRTAEKLSLSQTTVTLQIHNLEEELDLKLFERTSRSVRLTPAGQVFYEGTKKILALIQETVDSTKIAAAGYTGLLKIGFVDESNATGISSMIREYLKKNPTTRTEFFSTGPADLLRMLLDDQCDVIFTPAFERIRAGNLKNCKIGKYRLIAAFNKDHRFRKKDVLKYSDFAGEQFIYVSNSNAELDFTFGFVHQLEQENIPIHIIARTDNIDTVFFMVDANLGVTVIPEYFSDRFSGATNIRICRIEEDLPATDFVAVWKESKASEERDTFVDFIKQYFS